MNSRALVFFLLLIVAFLACSIPRSLDTTIWAESCALAPSAAADTTAGTLGSLTESSQHVPPRPSGPLVAQLIWAVLSILVGFFMIIKIGEILIDINWIRQHGQRFAQEVRRSLCATGLADITAIDGKFQHRQHVWMWARSQPIGLRYGLNIAYRIPTLVLLAFCAVALGRRYGGIIPPVLWLLTWCVCGSVIVTVVNTFIQKIHYGWYDVYKRDWTFNPLGPYTLQVGYISDHTKLSKMLGFFVSLCYLTIVGFATIYYALYTLDKTAFFGMSGTQSPIIQIIYFSTSTMATVGYGDIGPFSDVARILVILQIIVGPVLLVLIIPALTGPDHDSERLGQEPGGDSHVSSVADGHGNRSCIPGSGTPTAGPVDAV